MNAADFKARQIMPGLKPVLELLHDSPNKIKTLLYRKNLREAARIKELASRAGVKQTIVTQAELDNICSSVGHIAAHQGVVAILSDLNFLTLPQILASTSNAPVPLLLALDQVQDPGNLGALARTAWALGAAGILIPTHDSAKPGAGAMKSSAGALARLPICLVSNLARALDEAEEAGFAIYGACLTNPGGKILQNAFNAVWNFPAVLVLGSERNGIRPGVLKRCGCLLAIPFARPFDSLNIAQAGSILIAFCAAARTSPTS